MKNLHTKRQLCYILLCISLGVSSFTNIFASGLLDLPIMLAKQTNIIINEQKKGYIRLQETRLYKTEEPLVCCPIACSEGIGSYDIPDTVSEFIIAMEQQNKKKLEELLIKVYSNNHKQVNSDDIKDAVELLIHAAENDVTAIKQHKVIENVLFERFSITIMLSFAVLYDRFEMVETILSSVRNQQKSADILLDYLYTVIKFAIIGKKDEKLIIQYIEEYNNKNSTTNKYESSLLYRASQDSCVSMMCWIITNIRHMNMRRAPYIISKTIGHLLRKTYGANYVCRLIEELTQEDVVKHMGNRWCASYIFKAAIEYENLQATNIIITKLFTDSDDAKGYKGFFCVEEELLSRNSKAREIIERMKLDDRIINIEDNLDVYFDNDLKQKQQKSSCCC